MKPKTQQKLVFINDCGCIFDEEQLERAMLWWAQGSGTLMQKRKIYMHGRYPAVSIYHEKMHVHRLIKSYLMGRRLNRNEHVHHVDNNIKNCLSENLQLKGSAAHISDHLKGKPQDPEFARRRLNASCMARYGHTIHENADLLSEA